jgi:hypothetical protein
MSWRRGARAWLPFALVALAAGQAFGHTRAGSVSSWEIERVDGIAEAVVLARVPWLDLQRASEALAQATPGLVAARPDLAAEVDTWFLTTFEPSAGNRPCRAAPVVQAVASADPGHVARRFAVRCEAPGAIRLRLRGLLERDPEHVHIARVRIDGGASFERLFAFGRSEAVLDEPAAESAADQEPPVSLADFVRLGLEHIATGFDHVVFVLALLVIARSVREAALVVTGFTVAHSATLALGVLGVVRPASTTVEALIGLSIALVAFENFFVTASPALRRRLQAILAAGLLAAFALAAGGRLQVSPAALAGVGLFAGVQLEWLHRNHASGRLRWWVAGIFGLVHGLGFAGVLGEASLPADRFAVALLGFNAGVEIGQLAIVSLAWPVLRRLARDPAGSIRANAVQWLSAPVLAAGLFWFAARAAGS